MVFLFGAMGLYQSVLLTAIIFLLTDQNAIAKCKSKLSMQFCSIFDGYGIVCLMHRTSDPEDLIVRIAAGFHCNNGIACASIIAPDSRVQDTLQYPFLTGWTPAFSCEKKLGLIGFINHQGVDVDEATIAEKNTIFLLPAAKSFHALNTPRSINVCVGTGVFSRAAVYDLGNAGIVVVVQLLLVRDSFAYLPFCCIAG